MKKNSKLISVVVCMVMVLQVLSVCAFADGSGLNPRWAKDTEGALTTSDIVFDLIDGVENYSIEIYKDGEMVYEESTECESSDGVMTMNYDFLFKTEGAGEYTFSVSALNGEEGEVIAKADCGSMFDYRIPSAKLSAPYNIKIENGIVSFEHNGRNCYYEVRVCLDYGTGEEHMCVSGSNDRKTYDMTQDFVGKALERKLSQLEKQDGEKYSRNKAKAIVTVQAMPVNINEITYSDIARLDVSASVAELQQAPVVTEPAPQAPVEELKPQDNAAEPIVKGEKKVMIDGWEYDNILNNDLFDVIKELDTDDIVIAMDGKELEEHPTDDELYKAVQITVDYQGNVTKKDLCEWGGYFDALDILYGDFDVEAEDVFNDGLKPSDNKDEAPLGGLEDINGQVIYVCPTWDNMGYTYNLGYVCEVYNNAGNLLGTVEEVTDDMIKYDTHVSQIMSSFGESSFYHFYGAIDAFDDNGYSVAYDNEKSYLVKLKKPSVIIASYNGEKIPFDVVPFAENGRTLVPLRAIFETLGAEVSWDGATSTVTATKGSTTVALTIDNDVAKVNGSEVKLEVPARAKNGRTFVPVRFISDCFGVNVDWDGSLLEVVLSE